MNTTLETQALARSVYDYLIENPEKHDQGSFVGMRDEDNIVNDYDGSVDEGNFCNTTLCAAGTTVWLNGGLSAVNRCLSENNFENVAGSLLGLDDAEQWDLFFDAAEETALKLLLAVAEGDEAKFAELAD